MKKWNMTSKEYVIIFAIILVFIIYVFVFLIERPFDNEITQDRPFMRAICPMQIDCQVSIGHYSCTDDTSVYWNKKLRHWKGFSGCNNNTKGYISEDDTILVEGCSCGGIM